MPWDRPPLPRRNTPTFDDESTRRASGKYNSSTDPLRNASNASSCFDENPIVRPKTGNDLNDDLLWIVP